MVLYINYSMNLLQSQWDFNKTVETKDHLYIVDLAKADSSHVFLLLVCEIMCNLIANFKKIVIYFEN